MRESLWALPIRERHLARWLYGRTATTTARHVIEQGCELLSAAVGATLQPAAMDFPLDAAVEKACDALLARLLPGSERFVLIAATAGWGAKQWPAERYGAVAAELGRRGYRTLVNAASEQDPIARSVVVVSGGYAAAAAGDLPLLIALTRRAELVIAGIRVRCIWLQRCDGRWWRCLDRPIRHEMGLMERGRECFDMEKSAGITGDSRSPRRDCVGNYSRGSGAGGNGVVRGTGKVDE